MDISSLLALTSISDESAESIHGGFRFESFNDDGDIVSQGTIGTLNQRVQGTIAANVESTMLMSEEVNGSFLIEIPSRGFAEIFPAEGITGYAGVYTDDLPDGIAGSGDAVFITDQGASNCRPAQNPTCGRPGNSSGAGSNVIIVVT